MSSLKIFPLFFAIIFACSAAAEISRSWTDEVMYFALTDRFLDGDPSNNIPAGSDPGLFDPQQSKITSYHGGDFRGIEKALTAGYFNDLGVTTLWLSPVVKNSWREGTGEGNPITGYHGYWTQDFLDIDPHLVSASALKDNAPYSDDTEGRMTHYRDLVALAHSKGIRIIQDVVMNHAGPNFFYDANGNGVFDIADRSEWTQPFLQQGRYKNAIWANLPQWNLKRTQPDGPKTIFEREIPTSGILSKLESYARKGFNGGSLGVTENDESMTADFFSLRTIDTSPRSAHFEKIVDEFVEIYGFYLETIGVDGLRIDTVKHVHHEFWDAFTEKLHKKLGPAAASKILFGEIYDPNPEIAGKYTYRSDWPQNTSPGLDSVLDFDFCFAARDYLRHAGEHFGTAHRLEKSLKRRTASSPGGRHYYNSSKSADGLNSQQKIITFIENHDGINRFRVKGVTEQRHRLAQALVLTLPGIPCIYYGAEFALEDSAGNVGQDSETGRLTFFSKRNGPVLADVKNSASFREIARLSRLRAKLSYLCTGDFIPLWVDGEGVEDDGLFAFARASKDGSDFAVILMNASQKTAIPRSADVTLKLPASLQTGGRKLSAKYVFGPGRLPTGVFPADQAIPLPVPANSLVIYLPD